MSIKKVTHLQTLQFLEHTLLPRHQLPYTPVHLPLYILAQMLKTRLQSQTELEELITQHLRMIIAMLEEMQLWQVVRRV